MRQTGTSRVLVFGAAALLLPVADASADGDDLPPPAEGYGAPAPPQGYGAPARPPVYTAPPVYAAPVYAPPTVYVVPAPVYTAPWVAAPVPRHLYDYQYGYSPPPRNGNRRGFVLPVRLRRATVKQGSEEPRTIASRTTQAVFRHVSCDPPRLIEQKTAEM
jgi:hypothetical protein